MMVETQAITVQEIIARALALKPLQAAKAGGRGMDNLCRTPIFERVVDADGREHQLRTVHERYAVVYVRVSTEKQLARSKGGKRRPNALESMDGLSVTDQITTGINRCLKEGWAFCIISDAGIHGDVVHNEPAEIQKQRNKRATLYDLAYRQVIMARRPYTPAEMASMEQYLAAKLKVIRTRGLDGEEGEDNLYRARAARTVNFRPGLTSLMRSGHSVHAILLTDLTRLSRNESLTGDLLEFFADEKHKIRLVGTVDNLDTLNDQEGVGKLWGFIQGWFASEKLKEVIRGTMRGQITLLESGYPHGKLPTWCKRDDDGAAVLDPEWAGIVREMVRLFLEGQPDGTKASYRYVATTLGKRGYKAPNGGGWLESSVKFILNSCHLTGYQESYGLKWKTLPALIEDETTLRHLQDALSAKAETKRVYAPKGDGYLLQGLIRCACGRVALHGVFNNGEHCYFCRRKAGERRGDVCQHVRLRMERADDFFHELMQDHHEEFFTRLDAADEGKRLGERLAAWEAEAAKRRGERIAAEKSAIPVARERVAAISDPSDQDYEQWLTKAVRKITAEHQERVEEAEQECQRLKRALADAVPEGSLREQAQSWATMSNTQRNKVLRSIYRELRYEDHGNGKVHLIPVLVGGDELAPIKIEAKIWAGAKTTKYQRFFPKPEVWLRSLGKRQEWDEEFGQVVTVTHIPPMPLDVLERIAPKYAEELREESAYDAAREAWAEAE